MNACVVSLSLPGICLFSLTPSPCSPQAPAQSPGPGRVNLTMMKYFKNVLNSTLSSPGGHCAFALPLISSRVLDPVCRFSFSLVLQVCSCLPSALTLLLVRQQRAFKEERHRECGWAWVVHMALDEEQSCWHPPPRPVLLGASGASSKSISLNLLSHPSITTITKDFHLQIKGGRVPESFKSQGLDATGTGH